MRVAQCARPGPPPAAARMPARRQAAAFRPRMAPRLHPAIVSATTRPRRAAAPPAAAADSDSDGDPAPAGFPAAFGDELAVRQLLAEAGGDQGGAPQKTRPPPPPGAKQRAPTKRAAEGAALASSVLAALAEFGGDVVDGPVENWTTVEDRPGMEDAEIGDARADHRAGFVAIVGRPNAGKSTLLNACLGRKLSIVTPKAQTTRHRVLGLVSTDAYQAVLLDTPGLLRERTTVLDHRMQAAVSRATADADAVLGLVDAASPGAVDAAAELAARLAGREGAPPVALVLNKVDLVADGALEALKAAIRAAGVDLPMLSTCAATGAGVAAAFDWAAAHLPESPPLYPRHLVAEAPERFFVGEIVREKIFLLYRDEIPYCASVEVTDYKERGGDAKDFVAVTVHVERAQQRGIVLGAGGSALKRLGAAARADVELFLGRPVYLEISVKVAPKWRVDEAAVRRFGY